MSQCREMVHPIGKGGIRNLRLRGSEQSRSPENKEEQLHSRRPAAALGDADTLPFVWPPDNARPRAQARLEPYPLVRGTYHLQQANSISPLQVNKDSTISRRKMRACLLGLKTINHACSHIRSKMRVALGVLKDTVR